MMLQHLVPDLYASYGAYEARGEQGLGIQSLYVYLDDLIGYYQEIIVQSAGLPSRPPPASCIQSLLSTWQR